MVRGALYRAAREGGEPRRGGPVPRRHRHRGHPGAGPGPGRVRARSPARTRRCAGAPTPALREVVNLRVYLDLDRGWRVTMPNLEQAGLLQIGYLGLDGVAASDEPVAGLPAPPCADAAPEVREQVCRGAAR